MIRPWAGLTLIAVAVACLRLAGGADAPAAAPAATESPAPAWSAPSSSPPALPEMPAIDREQARAVYLAARAAGSTEPGMAAFRDHTERFLEHNAELVVEHARAEGLTRGEVGELTNFALVTERMQRWPAVEVLVGQPVLPATRALVAGLVRGDSEEMKLRLREHVAAGDAPAIRALTIRELRDHTRTEYFALTGMDAARLDVLLADAVLGSQLDPEVAADGDAPLAEGEVAEVADEVEPQARIVVIDRVVVPRGAALTEIEDAARRNPRFAAELERDRR